MDAVALWKPSRFTVDVMRRLWDALLADDYFCYGVVTPRSTSERRMTFETLGHRGLAVCQPDGEFAGWQLSDDAVVALASRVGITGAWFDGEFSDHPDDVRGELSRRKPALTITQRMVAELAVQVTS